MNSFRRRCLGGPLALWSARAAIAAATDASMAPEAIRPGRVLAFPRDHGAHASARIEWWYITGWLDGGLGFQITFFRTRLETGASSASRFAPTQLVFAHAALSDPAEGKLLHDEIVVRSGFGDGVASEHDTALKLGHWTLVRSPAALTQGARPAQSLEAEAFGSTDTSAGNPSDAAGPSVYRIAVQAREFSFDLQCTSTQPLLLQGERGYSRKGPEAAQASYYVSQPQLKVSGRIAKHGQAAQAVRGVAWLDHEWSNNVLDPNAQGWDWCGINLNDGGALMAYRIRPQHGEAAVWAGGTERSAAAPAHAFAPDAIAFAGQRWWTSPRTRARYPVEMQVRIGARTFLLKPLLDDQELDSRNATRVVYWEGAVTAYEGGAVVGRGYLELTGYVEVLTLG